MKKNRSVQGIIAIMNDTEHSMMSEKDRIMMVDQQEIEDFLVPLWTFLLERDDIDRDSDFFELGGRSLHMVIVGNHLRDRFGLHVPPILLAQYPTIAQLAAQLADADEGELL